MWLRVLNLYHCIFASLNLNGIMNDLSFVGSVFVSVYMQFATLGP
jgi:hypothetical protein